MKSKIKYENKYNELVEKETYGWIQPGWKEELTKTVKILSRSRLHRTNIGSNQEV